MFLTKPDNENTEKQSGGVHRRNKSNLWLEDHGSQKDVEENNDSTMCPICLCEYEDGEQICWSNNENCAHHFHAACGIAWLAKHNECPLCREEYLVLPEKVSDEENQAEATANDTPDRENGSDS